MADEQINKKCSKCGETKPLTEYFIRHHRGGVPYARCKACFAEKRRANYIKYGHKERELHRLWWAKDRERTRKVWREMAAKKRQRPAYRLALAISNGIWNCLKGKKSGRRSFGLIGYSAQDLMRHLERQFTDGMGWDNFGKWHIDHIIPLSSFVIDGPDDPNLRAAWALPNLRPLWGADNIRKRDRRTHLL